MEKIRCCIIDKKNIYRGVDRDVDMRVFNDKKNSAYKNSLDRYLLYLSTEEEYTHDNLRIVSSFSEYINSKYANSEVVLYSTQAVDQKFPLEFLGIDIVDQHIVSVIKNGIPAKCCSNNTNQYKLFCTLEDANAAIACLTKYKQEFSDLFCVHVYRVVQQEDEDRAGNGLRDGGTVLREP